MSTSSLRDICFDCADPHRIARFWADALGYTVRPPHPADTSDDVALDPANGGLGFWFNKVFEPKVAKNRVHMDINLPDEGEMGRLLGLGAHALGEIRGDDGTLWWTIMADPEGNEFCAFPPKR